MAGLRTAIRPGETEPDPTKVASVLGEIRRDRGAQR